MDTALPHTAFLGLGAMGYPMAAHLPGPLVWNRTTERAEAHAREHGSRAVTLEEAVAAPVVFSCLPTSAEVWAVLRAAEGALRPGSVWVDCTSGVPSEAQAQAAWLAQRGVAFLDAPVSGGVTGAVQGTLTVMVGGDPAVLSGVRPALAFAGRVVHVGDTGAGFAVKAVNNLLLAANLWAAGEGLSLLAEQGIDLEAALSVINASSGRSGASETLIGPRVLSGAFPLTFALGLLAKDAGIAGDLLRQGGTHAPLLTQTEALYRVARDAVGAGEDHTAALRWLEGVNGRELRAREEASREEGEPGAAP